MRRTLMSELLEVVLIAKCLTAVTTASPIDATGKRTKGLLDVKGLVLALVSRQ